MWRDCRILGGYREILFICWYSSTFSELENIISVRVCEGWYKLKIQITVSFFTYEKNLNFKNDTIYCEPYINKLLFDFWVVLVKGFQKIYTLLGVRTLEIPQIRIINDTPERIFYKMIRHDPHDFHRIYFPNANNGSCHRQWKSFVFDGIRMSHYHKSFVISGIRMSHYHKHFFIRINLWKYFWGWDKSAGSRNFTMGWLFPLAYNSVHVLEDSRLIRARAGVKITILCFWLYTGGNS